ncbi:MAG: outer membrane lipoprotein chaperone LolA [Thiotrichaceae bacterium]
MIFSKTRTLHAHFQQVFLDEKGQLLKLQEGEICRPGKFRWDYQKPYKQLIVADGNIVWVYDIDLEQVSKKPLTKALGKTPAVLLSSHTDVEEEFFVNNLPAPAPDVVLLELRPKDAQAQFENIRISLKNNELIAFELLDNLGQKTKMTFSQIEHNLKLANHLFIFVPPAGVDIIEEEKDNKD